MHIFVCIHFATLFSSRRMARNRVHSTGVGTETQRSFALTGCRASKGRYPSTSLDEKARTISYVVVCVLLAHTWEVYIRKNRSCQPFYAKFYLVPIASS